MKIVKPKRGHVTESAAEYYRDTFHRELTQDELRLMPYMQYVVMNEGLIERSKVNDKELRIITDLITMRLIATERVHGKVGAYRLGVTEKYWQGMCNVLAMTYLWRAEE